MFHSLESDENKEGRSVNRDDILPALLQESLDSQEFELDPT